MSNSKIPIHCRLMRELYISLCEEDLGVIHDALTVQLGKANWPECLMYIYHHKSLKEWFEILEYHYNLYHEGATRREMFINVCNGTNIYVRGVKVNEAINEYQNKV